MAALAGGRERFSAWRAPRSASWEKNIWPKSPRGQSRAREAHARAYDSVRAGTSRRSVHHWSTAQGAGYTPCITSPPLPALLQHLPLMLLLPLPWPLLLPTKLPLPLLLLKMSVKADGKNGDRKKQDQDKTTQDISRANWSPFRKCHLKSPLKRHLRRREKQDMKATQDPIMPTIKTAAQYFSQIQGRSAQNCKSIDFVIFIQTIDQTY